MDFIPRVGGQGISWKTGKRAFGKMGVTGKEKGNYRENVDFITRVGMCSSGVIWEQNIHKKLGSCNPKEFF